MKVFYTYLWLRYDGTPYYVGKSHWGGKPERAYRKGSPPKERVLIQEFSSEEEAFEAEKFLISFYGRKNTVGGILINLTDGGEGGAGHIKPLSARLAASLRMRGQKLSEEVRRKISEATKGRIISEAQRQEHRQKMTGKGNPIYGEKRTFSEEWCRRLSLGKIGHPVSEETKKKMSQAAMGRKKSEETRRKISLAKTKTHCKRGHELSTQNVWVSGGKKKCKLCARVIYAEKRLANASV
jgi:hypothetical protein